MKNKDRIVLGKIIDYTHEVERYIDGYNLSQFLSDDKTIAACAFVVGQIGELATRISDETKLSYDAIPWKNIRGMRNRLIHDYENIDKDILWAIVSTNLPQLRDMLCDLLDREISGHDAFEYFPEDDNEDDLEV